METIKMHGLVGCRAQVNDGKPTVAQADGGALGFGKINAFTIGSPVLQAGRHVPQIRLTAGLFEINKT
jgi:hypothetical protein